LRESIESETGALTASFTYVPGTSVTALADRLAALIRDVPGAPRVHLVGHSLGGIAVRWYVQELPLDPRVVQTICLASPFAGSRHARLMPGTSGRDLLPGSDLLRRLAARAEHVDLPHLSLAAANDLLVEPGAWLACGDRRVFPALGHNGLLYDREVIAEVVRRIRSVIEDAENGRRSRVRLIEGDGEGPARQAGSPSEASWPESGWVSKSELERRLSDSTPRVSSRR
jgi:pimeloyl-ACP methyl ester carboxylesterase